MLELNGFLRSADQLVALLGNDRFYTYQNVCVGLRQFKQTIETQLTHAAGLTWTIDRYPARGSATLEADNLTDAKAFDNYGVQRPGRAFYLKLTADI